MPPRTGDRIGAYRLEEPLGQGAFGQVFRARAERDGVAPKGTTVAMRILHGMHRFDPEIVERFHADARAAMELRHPSIARTLDEGGDKSEHYVVMELVEGRSLAARLRDAGIEPPEVRDAAVRATEETPPPVRNLPVEEVVEIVRQTAGALQTADLADRVHLDLSPENLVLCEDDAGAMLVKVLDFGLPKDLVPENRSLAALGRAGSPPYMSPEQFRGERLDTRADLYSLGAIAYLMLTGRPPFPGPTSDDYRRQHAEDAPTPACELNPRVPQVVSQVIDRLLAKDPKERYEEAAYLIEDIERVRRGEGPARVYRPRKRKRRASRFVVGARIAAAVLIAAAFPGVHFYRARSARKDIAEAERRAVRLVEQGKLEEARTLVVETLERREGANAEWLGKLEALRARVNQQMKKRDQERALQAEAETRARKEKARALVRKGDAFAKAREYAKAIAAYRDAAELAQRDDAELRRKLRSAQAAKKAQEEAEAAKRAALAEARRREALAAKTRGPKTIVVPDDQPNIQAAMHAARAGDTVKVKPGVYREAIVFKDGVLLTGTDREKCRIEPAVACAAALTAVGCKRGVIENITFDGGGRKFSHVLSTGIAWERAGEDARVRAVPAEGAARRAGVRAGMQLVSVDGARSDRLCDRLPYLESLGGRPRKVALVLSDEGGQRTFSLTTVPMPIAGAWPDGLVLIASAVSVRNCVIENHAGVGIVVLGDGSAPRLERNACRKNGQAGIAFGAGARGRAEANTCDLNGKWGIVVAGARAAPALTGNRCRRNGEDGIFLSDGARGSAADNVCEDNKWSGIHVREKETRPVLRGNRCVNNASWGIAVGNGATPQIADDNAATGNREGQIMD